MSASLPSRKAAAPGRWLPVLVLVAVVLAAARWLMPPKPSALVEAIEPAGQRAAPSRAGPAAGSTATAPSAHSAPSAPSAVSAVSAAPSAETAVPVSPAVVTASVSSGPPEVSAEQAGARFDPRQGGGLFGQKAVPAPVVRRAPEAAVPAPEPAVTQVPAPVRPAFSVIGTFQPRGEPVSLWINQGGQLTLARLGDVVDAQWRIEAIERSRVRLIHIALATPAELPLPSELAR